MRRINLHYDSHNYHFMEIVSVCCILFYGQSSFCSLNNAFFLYVDQRDLVAENNRKSCWLRNGVTPEKLTDVQLFKQFPSFMETEGSLPCSQGSATIPNLSEMNAIHILLSNFRKKSVNIPIYASVPRILFFQIFQLKCFMRGYCYSGSKYPV
jgi:hypothetical protein